MQGSYIKFILECLFVAINNEFYHEKPLLQNNKLCTYCVQFAYKNVMVSKEVCEISKPDTCEEPTDLKEATCTCSAI
jgi:hypothetical protein